MGDQTQHGKPQAVITVGDQLATRESQAGPHGVTERPEVLMKPDNAGGGKGPQLKGTQQATKTEGLT